MQAVSSSMAEQPKTVKKKNNRLHQRTLQNKRCSSISRLNKDPVNQKENPYDQSQQKVIPKTSLQLPDLTTKRLHLSQPKSKKNLKTVKETHTPRLLTNLTTPITNKSQTSQNLTT